MEVLDHPTLVEIKERMNSLGGVLDQREFLACKTVPTGVPRGVICEITGTARTAWMLDFLAVHPKLATFWAEERLTILPTALHQRGVGLSRVLMAETGDKLFQTLRKALKSGLFDAVVLPGVIEETKMLKALQLFTKKSNSCVFLLSQNTKNAWAIPFQLQVEWKPNGKNYQVTVLKSKMNQMASV